MIQLFKPYVSDEAIAAVEAVLRSGWIGLGPKTAEFESKFAEFVGARYAVGVNSATSALHLAAIVSGIGKGHEVLTTALTFVSTNHVLLYQESEPVFVDIDDRTLNIDLAKAEKLVSPRTRAIMAVHYAGNPVNLDELYDFASRHKLAVIEDAAHACGATFKGQRIGARGLTCFSFHAVKNLPMGDGGMVTTNDKAIYEQLLTLRWMGIDQSTYDRSVGKYRWEYSVESVGYKFHTNDIAAAIGLEHLKRVDEWNARRQTIVDMYRQELGKLGPEKIKFAEPTPNSQSANHLFVIRVANRDQMVDRLKENGISVGVHYKPNHHYPMYADARRGDLSVTERAYSELISLPLHLGLTDDDVRTVCSTLRKLLTP